MFFDPKLIFRQFTRKKWIVMMNVLGLSLGIAVVLLALLYWRDERSFDQFHQKKKDLYRITTTLADNKGGRMLTTGGTGQVQAPIFKAGVPELLDAVRVLGGGISGDVLANNKSLHLNLLFADPSFFNLFTFPFIEGNAASALTNINSVVITASAANKLFNSVNVVGKELLLDADPSAKALGKPLLITGVVQDPPPNSSIQFELLMPMQFMQLSFTDQSWLNAYLSTFVLLHPAANVQAVAGKFDRLYAIHGRDQRLQNIRVYGFDPAVHYGLQPVTDIHLNPLGMDLESGVVNASSPGYSYLFMGIAMFILLMAAINFINITIAGSFDRAKEVGIRKISGGSRFHILIHFLAESAGLCLLSFLAAAVLTMLSIPFLNELTGKHISGSDAFQFDLLLDCFFTLIAIVLLTGFYPAYLLSGLNAKAVLYNTWKLTGNKGSGKILVVFQFALAVFLLIATLVYYNQMAFIHSKDLGYDPNDVVVTHIPGDRDIAPIYRFLRNELANEPSIRSMSFGGGESVYPVTFSGGTLDAIHKVADERFLETMNIPLKAGRNFSASHPSDSSMAVLVNEAFVQSAGLVNPIGTQLRTSTYFDNTPKTIIGVIKNYHTGSLRTPIQPMVLFMNKVFGGGIWIKVEQANRGKALAALATAYKKVIPQAVFQYQYQDQLNALQYTQEMRWQKIIGIATGLSIALCGMGLFGMAHLSTRQRTKEIGIRKVLGASVAQVTALLSAGFLKLVLIGFVVAAPVAYLVMNTWLRAFAYRINPGAGILFAAGGIAVFVALLAVGSHAMRSAMANPVSSLRAV